MTLSEAITACYDPFPPEVIKIRQDAGTGNKALSYVGHPDYTRRLDAIFTFAWDFRTEVAGITDSTVAVKGSLSVTLGNGRLDAIFTFAWVEVAGITDSTVAVKGSLSVTLGKTVTRENYGHGQINKGFPLGDALKTAAVDAQKKCCSMFGIGLHLYDGDDQPGQHHATSGNGQHRGHDNGHYDPPPFNDDLGHDYHADPTPRRVNKGLSVMTWVMIRHQQRAARSLPFRISARAIKRIPRSPMKSKPC